MKTPLQDIPPVHRFTSDPVIAAYDVLVGHDRVRACIQSVLEGMRTRVAAGTPVADFGVLRDAVLVELSQAQAQGLIRIINGAGVLLHTNFGRAPLAAAALEAA